MAGIMNNTARQYNLKCIDKNGHRVTIRVAPGFNSVNDNHWKAFKGNSYVADLKKDGHIDFGAKWDDMELDKDPDTKAKSKSIAPPRSKSKSKSEGE